MPSQDRIARTAGAALLVICASGLLGNNLVVAGNAVATVHAIGVHARWYRVGVIGEVIMLNGDIVLAVAFYRLLAPFGAGLALAGTIWRLANAMMLALGVVAELVAVDVITDPHLSALLGSAQTPSAVETLLGIHGTAIAVGLIFFGLGAAFHAWLLWVARYVPRPLAAAYLAVTTAITISCAALMVFPRMIDIIVPWIIAPDFIVELAVALWLLARGTASSRSVGNSSRLPGS